MNADTSHLVSIVTVVLEVHPQPSPAPIPQLVAAPTGTDHCRPAKMRGGLTMAISAGAVGCALLVVTTFGLPNDDQSAQRRWDSAQSERLSRFCTSSALRKRVDCRQLLSTWDSQHPGPDTPFAWTGRNIAAIAAACVVSYTCSRALHL